MQTQFAACPFFVGHVPHHFDTGGREPDRQQRKMARDAPSYRQSGSNRLADGPLGRKSRERFGL
jgi:hypothetical protein